MTESLIMLITSLKNTTWKAIQHIIATSSKFEKSEENETKYYWSRDGLMITDAKYAVFFHNNGCIFRLSSGTAGVIAEILDKEMPEGWMSSLAEMCYSLSSRAVIDDNDLPELRHLGKRSKELVKYYEAKIAGGEKWLTF